MSYVFLGLASRLRIDQCKDRHKSFGKRREICYLLEFSDVVC